MFIMKKYLMLFIFTGFSASCLFSQWSPHDVPIVMTDLEIFINLKTKPAEEVNSFYLDDQWHKGKFEMLPDHVFENYPIKYDLKNNILEIQLSDEVKILELYRIREFSWTDNAGRDHSFINLNIKSRNTKLYGIAQVLLDGKAKLIKTYEYIPRPEYDVKYGAYSAIDHNYVREDLYLMEGEKILQVNGNRKRFMKFFNNYSSNIMSFVKTNRLKINRLSDLKQIIEYYNSLINSVFIS
jgi:hypothetical protein